MKVEFNFGMSYIFNYVELPLDPQIVQKDFKLAICISNYSEDLSQKNILLNNKKHYMVNSERINRIKILKKL